MAAEKLTPERIRERHALQASTDDLPAMRAELMEIMKRLEATDPGNMHPSMAALIDAQKVLDSLIASPERGVGALEKSKQVGEVERRSAVPAKTMPPAPPPAASSRAAVHESTRRTVAPIERRRRNRSLGLGSLWLLVTAAIAFSSDLAGNPLLGKLIPYTDSGTIRAPHIYAWVAVAVLALVTWVVMWREESRRIRFLEAIHDPDEQLAAARSYFEAGEFDDILIPQVFDKWLFRRASNRFPSDDYDLEREADRDDKRFTEMYSARDREVDNAIDALPTELRSGLRDARDEAIHRWVQLSWIELEDQPFAPMYRVIGEIEF